ncbi:MAG: helix-turn-helix domain-containing protein [Geobacteraceae bacterium]|nr:MAG: helix-turn-helix domain-containing protein [Geobacteraceae bacterium]
MPQLMLPLIPEGVSRISDMVSVHRGEDRWTYFLGLHPVYVHGAGDKHTFHIVTSMLIDSGACRHTDIIKNFGVSKSSVNRALKKLRKGGIEGFFRRKPGGRKGTVLSPEVLGHAQELLDRGCSRHEVALELEVRLDTLRKAINDGRLCERSAAHKAPMEGTNKSSRNAVDAAAANGLGTACTRVLDRVGAAVGLLGAAETRFEACVDVPNGGVLCALPALLENGLLEGAERMLGKINGYYSVFQLLLVLAFMALCRIKSVERLRGNPPGEFGKLLGLDRIPEVRCLREKMDALSVGNSAEIWAAHLSKRWMEAAPEVAGTLYVDGHVRVYHGNLTKLPRRYVTRQRLCLRGTTDYWVNDVIGQPFFLVEKAIDPGLVQVLEHEIVPRLLEEVPKQPEEGTLEDNPSFCRFILVFDREGYSPAFFLRMWRNHRVACISYHKHPDDKWPVCWFTQHSVLMPDGESVTMHLAEMGTLLGSGKQAFWVREVRKLTDSGHQTSLISTAYELPHTQLAARMFSRWCQENFFRYMKQHFEIDMLYEYGVVELPDTEKVVNPCFRELERSRNQLQTKIRYRRARFAEMTMHPESESDPEKYKKWLEKKSNLLEEIDQYEHQLSALKSEIKKTPRHIHWKELGDKDRFNRLLPGRKRLMDTIRMIAYRSETAMAGLLIDSIVKMPDARRLLQTLFVTDADILPDVQNNLLRVRVHNASTHADNRSITVLLDELNKAEVEYPGTNLHLVYELVNKVN